MPLLPDEARLLFLSARPDAVCGETYFAALAASHPNWRAVGALAEREKLLPVVWSYMREHRHSSRRTCGKRFELRRR